MQPGQTPSFWQNATTHIKANDPILGRIIDSYAGEILTSRGDGFTTLARSIIGQQISVKAAASIWNKIDAHLGGITPNSIQQITDDDLRSLGLSRQKIVYLNGIANAFLSGEIAPDAWHDKDDSYVLNKLIALKGVGKWTAEMFLIFYMLRPDVFPIDDVGLLKAIDKHYNNGQKLEKSAYIKLAAAWSPYRSVATWYLWRSLDPLPVAY